ncbi:MAG: hypothetical protein ABIP95_08720 [Pelobium sp.]
MGLKKIVLITSGQPSTNPRLVKEADALALEDYQVTVIYQYWDSWATEADEVLLKTKNWSSICVGGNPTYSKTIYLLTRLTHKIFRTLCSLFGNSYHLTELATCRTTYLLYRQAKKIKADLYIGHNLGALAPAVWAAKKNKAKCGFDAEDFHRNERINDINDPDFKTKAYLENKYFPSLNYITTASPLINLEYQTIFPKLFLREINNVFGRYIEKPSKHYQKENPLKLFWFSQKIGPDRGIPDVFKALKVLEEEDIEFHLLGKPRPRICDEFNQLIKELNFKIPPKIFYHQPIDAISLMHYCSLFDIGLCLEPGFSRNNEIALSNKLFTYLNTGLAIICTDTPAQKAFIKENPLIGNFYSIGNHHELASMIKDYIHHPANLNKSKDASYQLAQQTYNWEVESKKFLSIIKQVID